MKILVLDDDPARLEHFRKTAFPNQDVITVSSVSDCIEQLIDNEPFNIVSLDHDLEGKVYVPSGPRNRLPGR